MGCELIIYAIATRTMTHNELPLAAGKVTAWIQYLTVVNGQLNRLLE